MMKFIRQEKSAETDSVCKFSKNLLYAVALCMVLSICNVQQHVTALQMKLMLFVILVLLNERESNFLYVDHFWHDCFSKVTK